MFADIIEFCHNDNELTNYLKQIPKELWIQLVPNNLDDLQLFAKKIKQLRIKEKERNYVMELQQSYRLPLRPNSTVKETMIAARLQKIKKKNRPLSKNSEDLGDLPIDPFE